MNFDKVGSNGLGAFGSCPIPDVNFLFIFFFFLTGPKGDNDGVLTKDNIQMNFRFKETNRIKREVEKKKKKKKKE